MAADRAARIVVSNWGIALSIVVPLAYTWSATGFQGRGDLVEWLVAAALLALGVAGSIGFGIWRWALVSGQGPQERPQD